MLDIRTVNLILKFDLCLFYPYITRRIKVLQLELTVLIRVAAVLFELWVIGLLECYLVVQFDV